MSEKNKLDATIDDQATTREIKYLMEAHAKTKNPLYLKAAENGLRQLLQAQNKAGGWPQFYPDSSGYHKHITYNDQMALDYLCARPEVDPARIGAVGMSIRRRCGRRRWRFFRQNYNA